MTCVVKYHMPWQVIGQMPDKLKMYITLRWLAEGIWCKHGKVIIQHNNVC